VDQLLRAATLAKRAEVLVEQSLARAAGITALRVRNEHPMAKTLSLAWPDLVLSRVPVEPERHQDERRGQECRTVDAGVALQEIQRELHPRHALFPSLLQLPDRQVSDSEKARLPCRKRHEVLE